MKYLILGLLIVGQSLAAPERSKRQVDPFPTIALPELPGTNVHGFLQESGAIDDVFNAFDEVSVSSHQEYKPIVDEYKPITEEYKPVTEEYKPPHQEYYPLHEEYGPPAAEYGPPAIPEVRREEPTTTTEHYCPTQDYQAEFVPSPPEINSFPLPDVPIVPIVKSEQPVFHETYGPPTEIPVVIPEVKSEIPVYHEVYGPPAVPEEPEPLIFAPEPPILAPLPEYVPPATTNPPITAKLYPYPPTTTLPPETTIIPEVKSEIPVFHEVYGPPPVPETSTIIIPPAPPTLVTLPPYIPPVTTTLPPETTTLPPQTPKFYPYPPPETSTLPPTTLPPTTLPPITEKLYPYPPPTTTTTEPTTVRITGKQIYAAKVHSKYEDTHHLPGVVRSKRHLLKKKWAKPVVVYSAVPSYHYVPNYHYVPSYHHVPSHHYVKTKTFIKHF